MENASKALVIAGAILISIMLISIGIVLVNSANSVTETGKDLMESQKIQAFNDQFLPYKGKIKGSELKNLINLVNASNAVNKEHQVVVVYTTSQGYQDIENIDNKKTYEVFFDEGYSNGDNEIPETYRILTGPKKDGSYNREIYSEKGYLYLIRIQIDVR